MRDFATSDSPAVQAQLDRLAALTLPQGRFGLETIREILARLGDPQRRLPPVFHVAGTNGKGSTCAYLRAMLEAQGLSVHAATKPHLVRYNERIRLAGRLVSDERLASLLEQVLDASEDLSPSFFEVTTAATFLAFAETPADACVIEVGLGGRFDATNVLERPAACGVASLGIDHEAFLLRPEQGTPSDPLARIAFEKASIARPGSPLVTQAYPLQAAKTVIDTAMQAGAKLAMRGLDWFADISGDGIAYRDGQGELTLPLPTLAGRHQADNAALAVAMLRHQNAVAISPEAMASGIRAARWPARLQQLGEGPLTAEIAGATVWLDGGHNPDAARVIAEHFARTPGKIDVVLAMLANKDAEAFIAAIAPITANLIAIAVPGHDSHAPESLRAMALHAGIAGAETADGIASALAHLGRRGTGKAVLIAGSLYLAGDVLRLNQEVPD